MKQRAGSTTTTISTSPESTSTTSIMTDVTSDDEKSQVLSDEAEDINLPNKCQSLRIRSIRKRIETERNKLLPRARKPRERPAPLSKYRRRTANARERQRMHEVNQAFDKLKSTIPHHKLNQVSHNKGIVFNLRLVY